MNPNGDRTFQLREAAIRVALKTGLLKKCAAHGNVYDPGQHDYQGACMVATFLVNGADPMVAEFRGDRDQLTTMLRSICSGHGQSCPQCASTTVS
jgi:hypothetical protein